MWAITATLLLAGCGGDNDGPTGLGPDDPFAPELGIDLASMTQTASGMFFKDIVVGTGTEVSSGVNVFVEFTGWLKDGSEFDSGAFDFDVGVGAVIPGFDEGVMNMRVGGVRKIVLPPDLAYGSAGTRGIPGNATLIFEIEVTSVQ